MIKSISVLGVRADDVTMDEAVEAIESFVRSGKPHLIVTLAAEMVMAAQSDDRLKTLINDAALVVPDGGGIVWAARRIGTPIRGKVAGVELIEKLCSVSADKGWKLFFLGGKPGVAEAAAAAIGKKYPGTRIIGVHHGYFKDEEIVPILERTKPDILLAGLGFPKQEAWLAEHLPRLGIPAGIGVGGSFDVHSGKLKRAPRWMIALNLEWCFRLLQEPRRLMRMLSIPAFMLRVVRSGKS